MGERKDGGSVFPALGSMWNGDEQLKELFFADGTGMSLRDYFAGQIFHGISASRIDWNDISPQQVAKKAYEFADAMIEARQSHG